jgi:2-aminoethylphosphonate-pyruvate transaminase
MNKIETAVFLAAGLGSRLNGLNKNKPKGFLEVDGISLMERSVNKLINAGIKRFFFGTGYASQVYDDYTRNLQATCIKNEIYADTGSMYTLYNMRHHIDSGFLLLEADLLYDQSGLTALLEDGHADAILASGRTCSGDEVFIETDLQNHLVNLSKNASLLTKIDAELVGISKISLPTYQAMCDTAEILFEKQPKLDYEHVFVELAKYQKMFVKKIEDYVWCEIDDASHYQRAVEKIYPLVK